MRRCTVLRALALSAIRDALARARAMIRSLPRLIPPMQASLVSSCFHGWDAYRLGNRWIELDVVPQVGGRVMQYRLGPKEFLWVNPDLAGQAPPPSGVGPDGQWLNYGGDKLWPAPQGWDHPEQWPGPPDGVLDGSPHRAELLSPGGAEAALRLTSREDARTGIQFQRTIRVRPGTTRVAFETVRKNVGSRPRRWGTWSVTQLNAARADGGVNRQLAAWCPLNPRSHFADGYRVLYGARDNPTFGLEAVPPRLRLDYQYQVGKVALDSAAGWVATVDGASGFVFVQRFAFEPGREYPDGASVEFWSSGRGTIRTGNQVLTMPDDPHQTPLLIESELLSPLARLQPGESYCWHYEWCAAHLGGEFSVVDCCQWGATAVPASARREAGRVRVAGRWGVFAPGAARLVWHDAKGRELPSEETSWAVSPLEPLVLDARCAAPGRAVRCAVQFTSPHGRAVGTLGEATIE